MNALTALSLGSSRPEPTSVVRRPSRASIDPGVARRRRVLEISLGIGVPLAAVLLWQLATDRGWIDEKMFPPPSVIVRSGRELFADGTLMPHIIASLKSILIGFSIGMSSGFLLGTAMGVSRLTRRALEPMLNALYVVPKLALLPVFFTIFGFGQAPKIALVAFTTFFYVWIQVMESMATVPEGFREAAASLGVTRRQLFNHVLLPYALPQVFVAMRVAMAVSVLVTTAAEFVTGNEGLGYFIFNSRALFILDRTYVGIVVVAFLGVLLTGIIALIGRKATPWSEQSDRRR